MVFFIINDFLNRFDFFLILLQLHNLSENLMCTIKIYRDTQRTILYTYLIVGT